MEEYRYAECKVDCEGQLRIVRFITEKEYIKGKSNIYPIDPNAWKGYAGTAVLGSAE